MMKTTNNKSIAILMATYNGERFLRAQIDSILNQTCQDWNLYIHDDGSKDSTLSILKEYEASYPSKIRLLDYPPQGGALNNFMSLLENVESNYYMFSDQDDVWHPRKIEKSWKAMLEQEAKHPQKPIIVHTDVRVVDGNLREIHPSYRQYGHIYPERITKFEQCVVNITLGCAMLFNAQARTVSLDRPWKYALMHDGWVTTRTFAENGVVYAINEALMDYRNHDDNTIGATDGSRFTLSYRFKHFGQMLHLNIKQYRMLRSAGYGSVFTYYLNKFRLHIR